MSFGVVSPVKKTTQSNSGQRDNLLRFKVMQALNASVFTGSGQYDTQMPEC